MKCCGANELLQSFRLNVRHMWQWPRSQQTHPAWRIRLLWQQGVDRGACVQSLRPDTQAQIVQPETLQLLCNQSQAPCAWGHWAKTKMRRMLHVGSEHPSKNTLSAWQGEHDPSRSEASWRRAWPEWWRVGVASPFLWAVGKIYYI